MVVPRWEWRTFGETFGDAEVRLAALPPTRVDDSEELYILSTRVEGSIKGPGRRPTRRLAARTEEPGRATEWKLLADAEFPFAATEVATLLAPRHVSVPSLDRGTYAPDEFVAVPVHKHRAHTCSTAAKRS